MIPHSALKRLAGLEFRVTNPPENEPGDLLERLPFIVRDESSYPARLTWRIPSVLDGGVDVRLGEVMALGYLAFALDTEGDDTPALNLAFITEAMEHGGAGEMQRAGFFATLERFMVCALCQPGQFPALHEHIKRLTDADLTARYRAVLRGETPPDIFGDQAPATP